jgi:hypothetical protein
MIDFDSMRLAFGVEKSQNMTPNPLENLSRSRKRTLKRTPDGRTPEKAAASPCNRSKTAMAQYRLPRKRFR